MVCLHLQQALLSVALLSAFTAAHPGHGGLKQEIAERMAYLKHNPRDLDHCAGKLRARGIPETALTRRMAKIQDLRDEVKLRKRSLAARQTSSAAPPSASGGMPPGDAPDGSMSQNLSDYGSLIANTSHLSTLQVTPDMSGLETMIFGNNTCILNPEGEIGPYYVSGEYVRSNISETQAGVALYLDQQYIDTTTCEPIEGLFADIWHCNATGVYGGVVAQGNGDSSDASNLNATFLRGIQQTDAEGVVAWQTIYPGYYQGRATHIHMVTHTGATQLENGTIAGGNVTHVGQLLFDQSLTDEINANVYPYTTNEQELTENYEDHVFIAETLTNSDPVVNYVMLGEDLEDGLFAWITIGVDPGALYNTTAAATLSENGGYENDNGNSGPML